MINKKRITSVILGTLLATAMVGCNSGTTTPPNNSQKPNQLSESGNLGRQDWGNAQSYTITNNTSEDITITVPDSDNYDCNIDDGKGAYNCGSHDGAKNGALDLDGYHLAKGQKLKLKLVQDVFPIADYDSSLAVDFNNRAGFAVSSSTEPYDGKYAGALKYSYGHKYDYHKKLLLISDATKYDISYIAEDEGEYEHVGNFAIAIKDKPITAVGEITPGTKLTPGSRFISKNGKYELDVGKYGFNLYGGKAANNNTYTRMAPENIFDDKFDDDYSFLEFQIDSNLVSYSTHLGNHAFWDNGVKNKSADSLVMQNDGDLSEYSGTTKLWSLGTGGKEDAVFVRDSTSAPSNSIVDNTALSFDEGMNRIVSNNGLYELVMGRFGDLYIEDYNNHKIWTGNTELGKIRALFAHGNFGVYDIAGNLMWSTNTEFAPDAPNDGVLTLGDDGVLSVHNTDNKRVFWKSTDKPSIISNMSGLPNAVKFLRPSQSLFSPNGKYRIVLGTDGNLVEKLTDSGEVVWTSNSGDRSVIGQTIEFHVNGNGEIDAYSDAKRTKSKPLWKTGETTQAIDKIELKDDGNLVAYSGVMDMWNNGMHNPYARVYERTDLSEPGDYLALDKNLASGHDIVSNNGLFKALMQDDGNFAIYDKSHKPIWSTATVTNTKNFLRFQSDGNIVMYSPTGAVVWSSKTAGPSAQYKLIMQDDGVLVARTPTGSAYWASNR